MDQFLHGFYNLFLADRDIFAQRVIGTAIGNGLYKVSHIYSTFRS